MKRRCLTRIGKLIFYFIFGVILGKMASCQAHAQTVMCEQFNDAVERQNVDMVNHQLNQAQAYWDRLNMDRDHKGEGVLAYADPAAFRSVMLTALVRECHQNPEQDVITEVIVTYKYVLTMKGMPL